jgi:hypothetical protein
LCNLEGCLEMAWMMGYIKHFDGHLKDGTLHVPVGWVTRKLPCRWQGRPWRIREGNRESRRRALLR